MAPWSRVPSLEQIHALGEDTAASHVGLQFTGIDDRGVSGSIPLDERTANADRTLHVGALAIFAETLASVGANLSVDQDQRYCLGQTLEVHHPVPIRTGPITGTATQELDTGTRQVWRVDMNDGGAVRVAIAYLTVAVIER
jgi:1,4-dihydroxy-2-naphthoyl-CoA hydrolase